NRLPYSPHAVKSSPNCRPNWTKQAITGCSRGRTRGAQKCPLHRRFTSWHDREQHWARGQSPVRTRKGTEISLLLDIHAHCGPSDVCRVESVRPWSIQRYLL